MMDVVDMLTTFASSMPMEVAPTPAPGSGMDPYWPDGPDFGSVGATIGAWFMRIVAVALAIIAFGAAGAAIWNLAIVVFLLFARSIAAMKEPLWKLAVSAVIAAGGYSIVMLLFDVASAIAP